MILPAVPFLKKKVFWGWIGVILFAAAAYTVGISHESLWYDEAYSSVIAGYPFWQVPGQVAVDNHPPLYYILLSLVRSVLGNSEWALRSLSVAGAVGLVALGAGPVRRIVGNRNSFLYAAVVLFTPAVLIYAHEARMYSLAVCAVTAGALYGYLAVTENRTRDWALFGAATLAGAYLHYYGLIAAFIMYALVFSWLLIKRRGRLKTFLIVGGIVALAYLPWLFVFIRQTMNAARAFWLGPLSWEGIGVAFLQPFAYKEQFPARTFAQFLAATPVNQYLAFALAAILGVGGLIAARRKNAQGKAGFGRLVFLVYLGVVVTTIMVSLVFRPIFFSRYLLTASGLFLLLVTLGMGMLPGRYLPWIAAGLFAVLNLITIKDVYTKKFNHPMRQLQEKLAGAIGPDELIITTDAYSLGPSFYYWPRAVHYHLDNQYEARWGDVLKPFVPPLHNGKDLPELLKTRQAFWYITSNSGGSMPVGAIVPDALGWVRSDSREVAVEHYSPIMFTAQKYVRTE